MTERSILLKIRTVQLVPGEKPEVMELQSAGTLREYPDRTEISYEETEMTGLDGVTTTFVLYADKMTLTRSGEKLKNKMVFQLGKKTDSLYDVGFGALLVSVSAQQIKVDLDQCEFFVEYTVEVEHAHMGINSYQVSFRYTD